jgi:uncharacterized membrane protein YjjB (DUF3815 family)
VIETAAGLGTSASYAVAAALASMAYAVLRNAPPRTLLASALAGIAAWAAAAPIVHLGQTLPVFVGGAAVSAVAELGAVRLRVPVLTILAPGLIPLTPGLLAYHSILGLATGDYAGAVRDGVLTLFWAGALAAGVAAVGAAVRAARARGWSGPGGSG